MKFDPYLIPYKKINPKLIIHLNVRAKTVKLLGENILVSLHDFWFGNESTEMTPKA